MNCRTLLFTIVSSVASLPLNSYAADSMPSLPRTIFCAPIGKQGQILANGLDNVTSMMDDSTDRVRKGMFSQAMEQYAAPAIKVACADKDLNGFIVIGNTFKACTGGCDQVIQNWPIYGADRGHVVELCKADCQGMHGTLMGIAMGYQFGRGTW